MWENRRLTTLWTSTVCYRDRFIFFYFLYCSRMRLGLPVFSSNIPNSYCRIYRLSMVRPAVNCNRNDRRRMTKVQFPNLSFNLSTNEKKHYRSQTFLQVLLPNHRKVKLWKNILLKYSFKVKLCMGLIN
jgi:hypothetical protein